MYHSVSVLFLFVFFKQNDLATVSVKHLTLPVSLPLNLSRLHFLTHTYTFEQLQAALTVNYSCHLPFLSKRVSEFTALMNGLGYTILLVMERGGEHRGMNCRNCYGVTLCLIDQLR